MHNCIVLCNNNNYYCAIIVNNANHNVMQCLVQSCSTLVPIVYSAGVDFNELPKVDKYKNHYIDTEGGGGTLGQTILPCTISAVSCTPPYLTGKILCMIFKSVIQFTFSQN